MKIKILLSLSFLALVLLNHSVEADPGKEAARELGKDVQALQDKKKDLTSEQIAAETDQIFKRFEQRTPGEEDKLIIDTVRGSGLQISLQN